MSFPLLLLLLAQARLIQPVYSYWFLAFLRGKKNSTEICRRSRGWKISDINFEWSFRTVMLFYDVSVHLIIGQDLAIFCLFVCSPIWEIGGRHPGLTEIFRPPPVGIGRKGQVPLTDPPFRFKGKIVWPKSFYFWQTWQGENLQKSFFLKAMTLRRKRLE